MFEVFFRVCTCHYVDALLGWAKKKSLVERYIDICICDICFNVLQIMKLLLCVCTLTVLMSYFELDHVKKYFTGYAIYT